MREVNGDEVAVEGVRSPLIQAGPASDSEAVVFLHGNPGSRLDWGDLVGRVGEFGRALAFDMPGFGQADKPRDFDYRIEGYAAFIGGALRAARCRAGPPGRARLRRRLRLLLGRPAPRGPAERGDVQHRQLDPPRAGTDGEALATPVVGELVMALTNRRAWRRAMNAAIGPCPSAVRRPHVRRLRPRHSPRRAAALPRDRRCHTRPASGWVATLARA